KKKEALHLLPSDYIEDIDRWVPLRIPLVITNKISFEKDWGKYYSSEQWWFSAPVISCYNMSHFGYIKSECSNAVEIGDGIVNFPVPCRIEEFELYSYGFKVLLKRILSINEH
ncbi:hypothetical protein OA528_04060, partial [Gammaproteobacteria bacterium]|nr:hypothetical protein [Gammaproteobacteria bacterium]